MLDAGYSLPTHDSRFTICPYSVRNDFTGFAIAALIARKLTVANAISKAAIPAVRNTHHSIFILYAKTWSQLFMVIHAIGNAMNTATKTSFRKSRDSNTTIPCTEAPKTLRTPISFTLLSAV